MESRHVIKCNISLNSKFGIDFADSLIWGKVIAIIAVLLWRQLTQ